MQREPGTETPKRITSLIVDAVCLAKDELIQDKDGFRVKCDRQKTGTHVNNVIPAWLGRELLKVKNGNPEYFFWSGVTTAEDAPSYFHKMYRKVFKKAEIDGSSHDLRQHADFLIMPTLAR